MNKQSILQYLTSASDTFLLVAFFTLVSLPIVIAVGVQPIKDQASQPRVNTVAHVQQSNVLGVSTTQTVVPTPDPLSLVKMEVINSNDVKKYVISNATVTLPDATSTINTKFAGSYDLIKVSNPTSTVLNLNVGVEFVDARSTDTTLVVNGVNYPINRRDPNKNIPTISLTPNSDIIISLASTTKNLGTFKVNASVVK